VTSSYKTLLDAAYDNKPLNEVLGASPAALEGISATNATKLAEVLNVHTVAELAECRFHHAAKAILAASGRPSFDPGPPNHWLDVFNQAPLATYMNHPKKRFRFEFGPVYYRGRLDGTARVLIIGQDPSTNEILAQRAFVGQSGQRVQKLLAKIGITRSYLVLNAFLFSVHGQFDAELRNISLEPQIMGYRNKCFDKVRAENPVQAVIAFGAGAKHAYENWPGSQQLPAFFLAHPAAADELVLSDWSQDLQAMADVISPDLDGISDITPYGSAFTADDSLPVPTFDLPFGIPDWHRHGGGRSNRDGNSKIIWTSPLV
jgi:hypothetical protein